MKIVTIITVSLLSVLNGLSALASDGSILHSPPRTRLLYSGVSSNGSACSVEFFFPDSNGVMVVLGPEEHYINYNGTVCGQSAVQSQGNVEVLREVSSEEGSEDTQYHLTYRNGAPDSITAIVSTSIFSSIACGYMNSGVGRTTSCSQLRAQQ